MNNIANEMQAGFWEIDLDQENSEVKVRKTAQDAAEALVNCLDECGVVDIGRIGELCGLSVGETVSALRGAVVRDPDGWDGEYAHGFVLRDRYLSGNLLRKRAMAIEANGKYNGLFEGNVHMLDSAIASFEPGRVVKANLGAAWIPPEIIDSFITEVLQMKLAPEEKTQYDQATATWDLPFKSNYRRHVRNISTFGSYDMPALRILEKTLNARPVEVYRNDTRLSDASRRQIDKEKTELAKDNQRKITDAFDSWIFADDKRAGYIYDCFDSVFGRVSNRKYDGSFLSMPGMNESVTLMEHQRNAVARIVFNRNTLLAHSVGAGKTYTMIAAGQTLKRMGLSAKNMYVIPNSILPQWESDYSFLYPEADVFVVDRRNFSPSKREQTLEQVRDGDFDAILIADSSFSMIPLSYAERIDSLKRERACIMGSMGEDRVSRKRALKEVERINKQIAKVEEEAETNRILGRSEGICFDHLGVDTLFVDEAHAYKNVTVRTRGNAVFGVSSKGSAKCDGMLAKVHFTQRTGRGAVFATATPISNSITDVFVMQNYLQHGEMQFLDIANFENWSNTFAQREESVELDVDGSSVKTVTRLAHFSNMAELSALFGQIADFYVDNSERRREYRTIDIEIEPTGQLKDYFRSLSERADAVRAGEVNRSEDNLLKITVDGRKAALDLRLTGAKNVVRNGSKTISCAIEVAVMWARTKEERLTQLVFCDISTPKKEFNVYEDLKKLLMIMSVSEEEIAFVHDAASEKDKEALFEKVNNGEIRVLVGSTRKLGTGVNVQKRLCAVHHLDVPWKSSDFEQREGRMLRRGNECTNLSIYRYVTKDSFDAFSWQLLQIKQSFVSQFLSGNVEDSSECDFEEQALSFAQIKALAIGDARVKKYIQLKNQLDRTVVLQRALNSHRRQISEELAEMPELIARQRARAEGLAADAATVAAFEEPDKEERRALGEELLYALDNNEMRGEERLFGSYRGLDIVLPANMLSEEPLVILCGQERTTVKMSDDMLGNVRRLQIAANGLSGRAEKASAVLAELVAREDQLKADLDKSDPYSAEITRLRNIVRKMEKELTDKNQSA